MYMSTKGIIDIFEFKLFNLIKDIFFGVIFILIFSISKNTYLPSSLIPFYFLSYMKDPTVSRPDIDNIPKSLFVTVACFIVGIILHLIIHKPKFKMAKFSVGILTYGITLALGGILSKVVVGEYDTLSFRWYYPLMLIGLVLVVFFLFNFIANTSDNNFKELATTMNLLGLTIVYQIAICIIFKGDVSFINFIKGKQVILGWGVSNNAAMLLLIVIPFSIYSYDIRKFGYHYLLLFALEVLAILITVSKGSILVVGIYSVFIYICSLYLHIHAFQE